MKLYWSIAKGHHLVPHNAVVQFQEPPFMDPLQIYGGKK